MKHTHDAAARPKSSILVMSRDGDIAERVAGAFPETADRRVTVETAGFTALNGRASALVAGHDVVIFDARPEDRGEIDAISRLIAARPGGALFLAVADENLSIAEARKLREAGIGDVLPNTIAGPALRRAIDALLAAPRPAGGGSEGAIVAVAQARGGVGSTTVAVNLAQTLLGRAGLFRKAARRRVALVDLDLQFGSVNAFLDIEGRGGLLELIEAEHVPDGALLQDIMRTHEKGLNVLSAPAPLVPLNAINADTVAGLIEALRARHDVVVVDLPRALVDWVGPVLQRADRLALVTDTSVPSIRQAKRLVEFYREDCPDLKVEVVVNRESRPLMKSANVKEMERVLELPLDHWLPDAPREARRAADLGQPIVELYPRCRLARAYGKLAAATLATLKVNKKLNA